VFQFSARSRLFFRLELLSDCRCFLSPESSVLLTFHHRNSNPNHPILSHTNHPDFSPPTYREFLILFSSSTTIKFKFQQFIPHGLQNQQSLSTFLPKPHPHKKSTDLTFTGYWEAGDGEQCGHQERVKGQRWTGRIGEATSFRPGLSRFLKSASGR